MNELANVEILQLFNIIDEYKNGSQDCKDQVVDILKRAKHFLNKMNSNYKIIRFMNNYLMFKYEYLMKVVALNKMYIDTKQSINRYLDFLSEAIIKTSHKLKYDLKIKYYDEADIFLAIVLELLDMFNYLEIYFNYISVLESSIRNCYDVYNFDLKRIDVENLINSIESKIKLLEKKYV